MNDRDLPTASEIDPELVPGLRAPSPAIVSAAFAGGFVGTLARYGFDLGWPEHLGSVPHTTDVINAVGAFLAGFVATLLARRWPDRVRIRAFAVTGVLGGWTTMSGFAVAEARLGSSNGVFVCVASTAATLVIGVAGAAAGAHLSRGHGPA